MTGNSFTIGLQKQYHITPFESEIHSLKIGERFCFQIIFFLILGPHSSKRLSN